ncbi:MAG: heme-binding protein [Arenimonas sp.]
MATQEPDFTAVLEEGPFSVRQYPALVVAEVTVTGKQDAAANAGFRLLAGYIFGGNSPGRKIAMTAPVIQQPAREGEKIAMTAPVTQTGADGRWTVRFMMPSGYTLQTLPKPNDARVRLLELAPARMAVVRFSGLANAPDVERQTALLREFIARKALRAAGPASLARYNPPWTPWFMRRNEVMIPLE